VGVGAFGFGGALRKVFPATRHRREWVHKVANTLNALRKSTWPSARRYLADIRDAEDRDNALRAVDAFATEFGARWPKAVAKIVDEVEELLAFFDFPLDSNPAQRSTTISLGSSFPVGRISVEVGRRNLSKRHLRFVLAATVQRSRGSRSPLVRTGSMATHSQADVAGQPPRQFHRCHAAASASILDSRFLILDSRFLTLDP
jgi:hypothetical protein